MPRSIIKVPKTRSCLSREPWVGAEFRNENTFFLTDMFSSILIVFVYRSLWFDIKQICKLESTMDYSGLQTIKHLCANEKLHALQIQWSHRFAISVHNDKLVSHEHTICFGLPLHSHFLLDLKTFYRAFDGSTKYAWWWYVPHFIAQLFHLLRAQGYKIASLHNMMLFGMSQLWATSQSHFPVH